MYKSTLQRGQRRREGGKEEGREGGREGGREDIRIHDTDETHLIFTQIIPMY